MGRTASRPARQRGPPAWSSAFCRGETLHRQAGGAAQGRGHVFHKQDTERCKGLCGQPCAAGHKTLGRRAEVLPTVAAAPLNPASASCWQSVAGVSLPPVRKKVVPPARQAATGSQAQPWADAPALPRRPSAAANNCTLETPGSTVYGRPASSMHGRAPPPRSKTRVPAENDRGLRAICLPQQCANFVRFIGAARFAVQPSGRFFQQAARADDQFRPAQRLQPAAVRLPGAPLPCPPM